MLLQCGHPKINGKRINDWLVIQGYMSLEGDKGNTYKIPTPAGEELGITATERIIKGENKIINFFNNNAQAFVAQNALKMLGID